ncbi:hypothetical protein E3A20_07460 [Planctomyces bekefii]|uniref:Uncharacterized protein n=1 Tax=Planctomyces bekefii TaxID=1653850 RepID=A0A5C6MBI1_9PLAN|nr:hypothetical protein E3A20_07460 [Planctomyces bekefii]
MFGYKDHEKNSTTQGVGLADFLALSLLLSAEGAGAGWQDESSHAGGFKAGDALWRAYEALLILLELEVTAAELAKWTIGDWTKFVDWLESFGDLDRRRCMQMAFEANYRKSFLHAVSTGQKQKKAMDALPEKAQAKTLQAVFCIDEREESIRRYFEELIPGAETFGAAGFFGIDMCFKDAVHGAVTPLCPPVISPKHLVIEKSAVAEKVGASRAERFIFEHSRSLTGGAWISQLTGIGAALPLVSQVLAPKNKATGSNGAAVTDLEFEYTGRTSEEGLRIGYTVDEMADRVEAILRGIGLVDAFAKVVMLVGHGSKSLNNPHESAHDCGACGGNRGSKNSRVFARMANHPGVRQALKTRGVLIPESTWFVGAYHDTCSDELDLFDVHLAPDAIRSELQNFGPLLRNVRAHNAAERCRRFSVGNSQSTEHAYNHVLKRAHDLRQPRPEYGHATNAALVVGRRNLTAGLFLDRRAFLLSYDPTRDSGGVILGKLLQAVIPVCAGINLEYFFSFMDNERYGCGTKLPHNIAGLLGVMNGAQSDLRAGLPLQMIEVHEPMRLLVAIETTPAVMDQLMRENRALNRYVSNGWIQLTVVDGDSGEIFRWSDSGWLSEIKGGGKIPQVVSSRDYTVGQQNFLAPVLVNGGV